MTLPIVDPVTARLYAGKTHQVGAKRWRKPVPPPVTAVIASHTSASLGLCRLPPLGRTGGSGNTPPLDRARIKRQIAAAPAPTDGGGLSFNKQMAKPEEVDHTAGVVRAINPNKKKDFGFGHPQWSPYYKPENIPELKKLTYCTPVSQEYGSFTEVDYLQELAASMDAKARKRAQEIALALGDNRSLIKKKK